MKKSMMSVDWDARMSAIRTRVRCVDAMWATKDKRVRKTLKKICKEVLTTPKRDK